MADERPTGPPPLSALEARQQRDVAITRAADAFGELCSLGADLLELMLARQNDPRQATSASSAEDDRWRCPQCEGAMQVLPTKPGEEPIYGCARGHSLVRATDEEIEAEGERTLRRQREEQG